MDRYEYRKGALDDDAMPADPIPLATAWIDAAVSDSRIIEPHAIALATVDARGHPHCRMVLLRGFGADGLRIYTNYESDKGHDLEANPWAAATIWWAALERQIRFEGPVERLSDAESDAYFNARPPESRRASAASPQSRPVDSRASLEAMVAAVTNPERPAHWGGYLIRPRRIEFWQGRTARLHDRFRYERTGDAWTRVRLAP